MNFNDDPQLRELIKQQNENYIKTSNEINYLLEKYNHDELANLFLSYEVLQNNTHEVIIKLFPKPTDQGFKEFNEWNENMAFYLLPEYKERFNLI